MNIKKRTVWGVDAECDNYWLQRACEQVAEELGLTGKWDLDGIIFSTESAAFETAGRVLRAYTELTPHVMRVGFHNRDDAQAAMVSIGLNDWNRSTEGSCESQYVGEPGITHNDDRNCVQLIRHTETRWVRNAKVTKTVTVEGETYTKESKETTASAWFPGEPVIISVWAYPRELIEIE
jgi:hypothetical protein